MQCKQMWTFLDVFICGKKTFFQHGNQSYFLLGFAEKIVLQFAIHPCLLCVQKIRNQRFSSVLQKQE